MIAPPAMPVRRARRENVTREEINNATPIQLLNMLFARLMLDLERGRLALEAHDYPLAHTQLVHAQAIITELSSSLNLDTWGGARNLLGLYQWCEVSISRGNLHRNPRLVADAIALLAPIQKSWQEAASAPDVVQMSRNA